MELWPGITYGFDSRCSGCCWAQHRGQYQVKVRNQACEVHGGDLQSCQRRGAATITPLIIVDRMRRDQQG